MIAVDAPPSYTALIVALLGSGGFLGGIYALLKLRPEAGQITVNAAQGAVIVQMGVIETLQAENARLQERIDDLENTSSRLQSENDGMRKRIKVLEGEVVELKNGNGNGGPH